MVEAWAAGCLRQRGPEFDSEFDEDGGAVLHTGGDVHTGDGEGADIGGRGTPQKAGIMCERLIVEPERRRGEEEGVDMDLFGDGDSLLKELMMCMTG